MSSLNTKRDRSSSDELEFIPNSQETLTKDVEIAESSESDIENDLELSEDDYETSIKDVSSSDYNSDDSVIPENEIGEYCEATMEDVAHISKKCVGVKVTTKNMLALELEMEKRLKTAMQRIQKLYRTMKKIKQNTKKVIIEYENQKNYRKQYEYRGAYLKGGKFYSKGILFFRDINRRNCPPTPDYIERVNKGEMFPMDIDLIPRHIWSAADKLNLVKGVKDQIVMHLLDEQRRSLSSLTKKRAAVIAHSEKLKDLLTKIDDKFHCDWNQLSKHDLKHRHSSYSCKAMWDMYLHPDINRSAWTDVENELLREKANEFNYQNWPAIAMAIGTKRSAIQCFIHYSTFLKIRIPGMCSKWTEKEDEKLLMVVKKYSNNGLINWGTIVSYFPNRTRHAIFARYHYRLRPNISRERFTMDEDLLLCATVNEYGGKVSNIPRSLFPNRTCVQLSSRYRNTLQNREHVTPWSIDDDKKLLDFVALNGISSWLKCAETIRNHTRTSCRTRYLTIQKFLNQNPNGLIEDMPRKRRRTIENQITTTNWKEKLYEVFENNGKLNQNNQIEAFQAKQEEEEQQPIRTKKKKQEKPKKEPKACGRKKIHIELDETGRLTVQRSKKLYYERLRPNELKLYNFFKYAYNFKLGTDVCVAAPKKSKYFNNFYNGLQIQILKPQPKRVFFFNSIFPANVNVDYARLLRRVKPVCDLGVHSLALPSRSTAMACLALSVLGRQPESQIDEQTEHDFNKIRDHPAAVLHRIRLRYLLACAITFGRLHPKNYESMDWFKNSNIFRDAATQEETSEEETKSDDDVDSHNESDFYEAVTDDQTMQIKREFSEDEYEEAGEKYEYTIQTEDLEMPTTSQEPGYYVAKIKNEYEEVEELNHSLDENIKEDLGFEYF